MHRPTLLLAALVLALAVLAGCGDNEADVASKSERAETKTQAQPAADEPSPEEEGEGCKDAKPFEPRDTKKRKAPTQRLSRSKRYTAVLDTSCGTIEIALDTRRFPRTASSFAALAREDFYDGLPFHRIVPDFVVQGGSPDGTGTGEPGYRITEDPPETVSYPRGTVAMAKTQEEDPGTSGSQFFMVTSDQAQFDPVYAVVGRITKGQDALDRLAQVPADPAADYEPTRPVVIEDVTIRER